MIDTPENSGGPVAAGPSKVVRRVLFGAFAMCALGGVGAAVVVLPHADAAPAPCTAAGFANTASSVLAASGQYLDAHPDANAALTDAGAQGTGGASVARAYFVAHPQQYLDLKGIAQPLTDLRGQCNVAVSPNQVASLFDALS